jgi:hypothetical protein
MPSLWARPASSIVSLDRASSTALAEGSAAVVRNTTPQRVAALVMSIALEWGRMERCWWVATQGENQGPGRSYRCDQLIRGVITWPKMPPPRATRFPFDERHRCGSYLVGAWAGPAEDEQAHQRLHYCCTDIHRRAPELCLPLPSNRFFTNVRRDDQELQGEQRDTVSRD